MVTFTAKYNEIAGLQDGLFDGLQSLVNLNLSHNSIAFIGLRVFSNSSDITSLRLIDLQSNKLTSLEQWCYYRLILGRSSDKVNIYLQNNLITNFTNKIQFHYRWGMKLPFGFLDIRDNKIFHIMDILHGWNLRFTDLLFLANTYFDRSHYTHAIVAFGADSYDCDCVDFVFYQASKFIPRGRILRDIRCDVIHDGIINITLSEFICELTDRCPPGCRCAYRPLNFTLHVKFSSTNFSSLPLDLPSLPKSYAKYKLDFSNNKLLRRLEHRPYFVNTSILDVSNCAIDNIDINVWRGLVKMQATMVNPRIYLQHNQLKSVPREVTNINFTSVSLALNKNPWECFCENSWMIDWFKSLTFTSHSGGDVLCASPSRLEGSSITQAKEDDFCVDPANRMLTISLSSTLSLWLFC